MNIPWIVCFAQINEFSTFYIIGDNVNIRADTSLSSQVYLKVNFGEEFLCRRISDNWFEWKTDYENGFISSKYVSDEANFTTAAEKLETKNGTTLYSLLKYYKKIGQLAKAEDMSIEIINNFKLKDFPVHREWCPLYGELAFFTIVADESFEIDYSDKTVYDFCTRVVKQSKDSLIVGLSMHTMAKCQLLWGNFNESEAILLKSIREYGDKLFIPSTCEYDVEHRTSLIVDIKNLVFILYNLGGNEIKQNIWEDLKNICLDPATSEESKAIATDIRLKLLGQFWDNKFTNIYYQKP
jgi:hypothetical protein